MNSSVQYLVKFLTCTPTYIDGLLCQRVPRFLTPRQLHNNTFRHIARFFNLKTLLDVWERHIHISERRRLTAQKRTSQKFAFHIVAHRGKQNKKKRGICNITVFCWTILLLILTVSAKLKEQKNKKNLQNEVIVEIQTPPPTQIKNPPNVLFKSGGGEGIKPGNASHLLRPLPPPRHLGSTSGTGLQRCGSSLYVSSVALVSPLCTPSQLRRSAYILVHSFLVCTEASLIAPDINISVNGSSCNYLFSPLFFTLFFL